MCEDCCPTCGRPYYDAEDGDEYTEMSAEQKAEQALRNSPLGMAAHPDNEAARRAEFERRKKVLDIEPR